MDYFNLCKKQLVAVACGLLLAPGVLFADDETEALRQQLLELKQQMQQMQQHYEGQIGAMEQRLQGVEVASQRQAEQAAQAASQPVAPSLSSKIAGVSNFQIGLSGLFAAGGSSADNGELAGLQGGGHDPNKNGFTVQNVELSMGGTVDPHLDAQANLIFQIDEEGETVVELEEAFFTTRSLPWGLQVKGGQYFTEFGRQNVQHPHTWAFADQPVVLSRFLGGDGLRSQGARVAWLMPTEWYSELYFGAQNAKGETVTSFLGEEGEDIGGHTLMARESRNFSDLLYSARWLNGFDLSETVSMNLGASALWGPNATGTDTNTQIYGADLYVKWQSATAQRGFPFASWQTEILERRYEAGDVNDPTHEKLDDWGMFTQAVWGFKPGWTAGLRLDYASASGDTATDPLRDTRKRLSPNLTWYPSEYSKVRLQYNHDWIQHLPDKSADALWLQVEFNLGSHAAHVF
ncbi:MAG: TonB-dependent receptor [Gammaproteobacteria bacterium]|nr:TonB-dependent receptor [Gammaproteobacteria bacterium]